MPQDIIQLLPDSIANQIAAGEVVQRPASIVKELMENAIDAQSTSIKVYIQNAGKALVKVVDNGVGMSETDARLAFERHATSKIRQTDDLFNIQTMGFRGEALASIVAVAQVELKTKQQGKDLGTFICIEGSNFKSQESITCANGTSIAVKNVFFNVPARRNFLKSNPVEMRHIIEQFNRIALAYPDIEFGLFHNENEVEHLPKGKLSARIVHLFGKHYQRQLVPCQENTPLVRIKGYIGRPEKAKKTRGEQFFFVNNRFVKHHYLHHAVVNAFEGLISDDTYPFYVLFLEIEPKHIDVNIHPTKTEIKFDDERSIYAVLQATVRKALQVHNLNPSIDFDHDVNFSVQSEGKKMLGENELYQGSTSFNLPSESSEDRRQKNNLDNWEKLYEDLRQSTPEENPEFKKAKEGQSAMTFQSKINQIQNNDIFAEQDIEDKKRVFQLHQRYIVSQVKSGMLLIDQKAAQERILYEKYLNQIDKKSGNSQQLLFPSKIAFNSADSAIVSAIGQEIRNLGFIFEKESKNTILLKGVPSGMGKDNEKTLFEGFIEQFKNYQESLDIPKTKIIARALAKKATARLSQNLSEIAVQALIDQLFASSNPNYAPDGKPILVILSLNEIENFFK